MNIRNLLFTSIIVCAAPIICADTKVTLSKQEQETINQWIKQVKQLPSESKKVAKVIISLTKDYISLIVNKVMRVGRDKAECTQEMIKEYDAFGERVEKEFKSLEKKLKKFRNVEKIVQGLDDIFESCPLGGITVTENTSNCEGICVAEISIEFGDDILFGFEKMTTANGKKIIPMPEGGLKVITEEDMASMKKVLARYSFAAECL